MPGRSLFARLFGRPAKSADESLPAPHLQANNRRRIYAIGDIHGRLDLLDRMHALIQEDWSRNTGTDRAAIVYLGDYIDRGPQSRQVVDRLILDPLPEFDLIHLCGNHDDFLLKFLEDPGVGPVWFRNGGAETMESYGIEVDPEADTADMGALRDSLVARLPDTHRDFFRRLRYSYVEDGFFFAHAGVRPKVPLEVQTPYDLMWIRDEFLEWKGDFGKIVVHGHTPTEEPVVRGNRIGIDTGAVWTGRLTCVVLDRDGPRFLATE